MLSYPPVPIVTEASLRERQFNSLLHRIAQRQKELIYLGVHNSISELISQFELNLIYDWIFRHKEWISQQLQQHKSLRIPKSMLSALPRTITFRPDIDGELMLIVSTKRKVASAVGNGSHKDLINIPIFGGKSKKGKPAWRVDSPVPIKLAEMVLKEYDPTALGTLESQISQDLTLNAHPLLFSCNLPGPIYMKLEPGTYKKVYHRALYSRFTKCTLQELLNNENIFISTVQRRQIAFELLTAIKKMHELGYIHQDLHRGNILIHPDENGNYHIQLTDFGNSRPMYLVAKNQIEHLGDAKAPYTYESPEMLIAYRDGKFIPYREKRIGHHESYAKFCQPDVRSATEAQQRYYSHPHRANDIWAAGLIIFDLFNRHQSPEKYHDVIQNHTLFKRMLAVNREDRFTAQEALDTLRIYPDSFAIADDHPVQYWNPAPMQDVGQEPPINSESVVIPEIRKKAYTAVIEERTRTSGRFSFRSKN